MSADSVPLVSVVMPCRNEATHIAACLDSVLRADYPEDRLELIVADGMSHDGTAEILDEYASRDRRIRVIQNRQKVVAAGLNQGIAVAQGDVIVRMDAHARYPSNYLPTLIRWLHISGADNVGAVLDTRPADESTTAKAIARALRHPFGVGNSRFRVGTRRARWVDTVPFGCYRREVFRRIGGFDEELVRNQDDEFNLRLIRSGGRVLLVPDVMVTYFARRKLVELGRMLLQYGRFKPLVIRKVRRFTLRSLAPPMLVFIILAALVTAYLLPSTSFVLRAVLVGYIGALLLVSAATLRAAGWRVCALLPVVFLLIHFAYGIGFLWGMLDTFALLGKPRTMTLSR